ncbi:MAG: hypothetical protein IKP46_06515 [Bacteroidales bacterium]|nr:hypothetical protein [Bacteroidales bacterium]
MKTNDNYLTSVEVRRIQDYISKHALVSLGVLKNVSDPDYEIILEKYCLFDMLVGVMNNEDNRLNAMRACNQVESMGYSLDEDYFINRVLEIHRKCELELVALKIALDLLYHGKEDPSVVFLKVRQLLD